MKLGENYPEILGRMTTIWNDKLNKMRDTEKELSQKKQDELANEIAEKSSHWEEAVKLVYPEKEEEWERFVYNNQVLPKKIDATISIMEQLENGDSFEDVFKNLTLSLENNLDNTNKKEASNKAYEDVWGVMLFSKRGVEFFEYYVSNLYLKYGIDESRLLYANKSRIDGMRKLNESIENANIKNGTVSQEFIDMRKNDRKKAKECLKALDEIDDLDEI